MAAFGFLAAPARRALANAGIVRVGDLSRYREEQILALHGMGANALAKLKAEMARSGCTFAAAPPD